jgi:thiol-disulfide isomerase/thioredoxin
MKGNVVEIKKRAAARAKEIRPKRRHADVDFLEIDGEVVIYDLADDSVHHLNQTAGILWQICDGSATLTELAADISDAFGVPVRSARRDVRVGVRGLGDAGLMEVPKPRKRRRKAHSHEQEGLAVGAEIPPFSLAGLDGRTATLDDFAGSPVLLVNWSTRCGYCDRIAPELASLQDDLGARGVRLVFLSFGTAEENREKAKGFGLASPILLQDGSAAEVFAGMGTPSAYLLDAEGKVAEPLRVGADQVPELARRLAAPADAPADPGALEPAER